MPTCTGKDTRLIKQLPHVLTFVAGRGLPIVGTCGVHAVLLRNVLVLFVILRVANWGCGCVVDYGDSIVACKGVNEVAREEVIAPSIHTTIGNVTLANASDSLERVVAIKHQHSAEIELGLSLKLSTWFRQVIGRAWPAHLIPAGWTSVEDTPVRCVSPKRLTNALVNRVLEKEIDIIGIR